MMLKTGFLMLYRINQRKQDDMTISSYSTWSRPPNGILKCSYNAAYNLNTQQVHCGWIIRDSYRVTQLWGSTYTCTTNLLLEAEAMAFVFTMQST